MDGDDTWSKAFLASSYASRGMALLRQRVGGDLLHTAAIVGHDGEAVSAVTPPNDYAGPGTGYRPEGERWDEMERLRHTVSPSNPEA